MKDMTNCIKIYVFQYTMKLINTMLVFFLLGIALVAAHAEEHGESIAAGKELAEAKIPCANLNEEQLEVIGEYYMEQMHPGEQHEQMDEMMGGEGSAQLTQTHLIIAQHHYCGNFSSGMMMPMGQMMQGMMSGNSGGMMGNQRGMMPGIMGSDTPGYTMSYWSWWNVLWYVFWIGIVILLVWILVKLIRMPRRGGEHHG